jgi:hypothetical protein
MNLLFSSCSLALRGYQQLRLSPSLHPLFFHPELGSRNDTIDCNLFTQLIQADVPLTPTAAL